MTLEREMKRFTRNVNNHHVVEFATGGTKAWRCTCGDSGSHADSGHLHEHFNPVPTYTIELIVAELKRIGKWEGFVDWIHSEIFTGEHWARQITRASVSSYVNFAEVIIAPLLLLQAASAYIEEVG